MKSPPPPSLPSVAPGRRGSLCPRLNGAVADPIDRVLSPAHADSRKCDGRESRGGNADRAAIKLCKWIKISFYQLVRHAPLRARNRLAPPPLSSASWRKFLFFFFVCVCAEVVVVVVVEGPFRDFGGGGGGGGGYSLKALINM